VVVERVARAVLEGRDPALRLGSNAVPNLGDIRDRPARRRVAACREEAKDDDLQPVALPDGVDDRPRLRPPRRRDGDRRETESGRPTAVARRPPAG
jgi:hypothetical protein